MSIGQLTGFHSLPRPTRLLRRSGAFITFCFLLWLSVAGLREVSYAQISSQPSQGSDTTFSVSGMVVNAVTGQPIPRALVMLQGSLQRTSFSDGEGNFEFDELPGNGRFAVNARKPGYYTDPQYSGSNAVLSDIGPATGSVVVKLTPQSAIYGRVTDASGQPIEHVPVHLSTRELRDGRKRREPRGMTESDEDGRFRFANLMPGTYYLAAGPGRFGAPLLASGGAPKMGYPSVYYAGVPDLSSASPIQLSTGQQAEADFSLSAAPVYQLAGTVAGCPPDQGAGVQLLNLSGDDLGLTSRFNMETGVFRAESVPAGSYIVKAFCQAGNQSLRGETRVNVAGDMGDLHVAVAPAISIPVVVRMESRNASGQSGSGWATEMPPISVRLLAADGSGSEFFSNMVQQSPGHFSVLLQNVDPGRYTVELIPRGTWYVQSATYAQTNLLYDDVSVTPGSQGSLDITLRDDSASLSGSVRVTDGVETPVKILGVLQPVPKSGPKLVWANSSSFDLPGLAPGEYLVFAFDRVEGLEYGNPEVLQAYASQAAHVTLAPGQKAQVTLDLIHTGKGE